MSTVDQLKKRLKPILANIRDLQARLDALEQKNCHDLMIPLTVAHHNGQMVRSLEEIKDVARQGHDISRLKVRLQHLRMYEGKFKRQVRTARSLAQRERCVCRRR